MSYKEKPKFNKMSSFDLAEKHDTVIQDNWALRAFAALLETSTLENFDSCQPDAEDYKYGLRRIVECYLEHQERKLNEIQLQAQNSPESFINDVKAINNKIEYNLYKDENEKSEMIKTGLNKINLVISEFGDRCKEAYEIRDSLLNDRDLEVIKKQMKMSA